MNPVVKFLNNLVIAINRLLDSMSIRTVQTIRRVFIFFTFIMCLVGVYIGYDMGTSSARIKSPPLAEFVNDTFSNDISRERDKGSFSGMLESEMVKESDTINSNKADFFVRERLNTEKNDNVIDSGKSVSDPHLGEKVYTPDTPVDSERRFTDSEEPRIKPLEKTFSTENRNDIIIQNRTDNSTPGTDKTDDNKTDIRLLEKDRVKKPGTILKDEGMPAQ